MSVDQTKLCPVPYIWSSHLLVWHAASLSLKSNQIDVLTPLRQLMMSIQTFHFRHTCLEMGDFLKINYYRLVTRIPFLLMFFKFDYHFLFKQTVHYLAFKYTFYRSWLLQCVLASIYMYTRIELCTLWFEDTGCQHQQTNHTVSTKWCRDVGTLTHWWE